MRAYLQCFVLSGQAEATSARVCLVRFIVIVLARPSLRAHRTLTSTGPNHGGHATRSRDIPRRSAVPEGLARRRIKTSGDVKAALALIPITKPTARTPRWDESTGHCCGSGHGNQVSLSASAMGGGAHLSLLVRTQEQPALAAPRALDEAAQRRLLRTAVDRSDSGARSCGFGRVCAARSLIPTSLSAPGRGSPNRPPHQHPLRGPHPDRRLREPATLEGWGILAIRFRKISRSRARSG
jgi:hypothetical protein